VRVLETHSYALQTSCEDLFVNPLGTQLKELQSKLESRHKIYKLREALEQLVDKFDQIFIDTPPALNFYTRSALIAAHGYFIPFDCDDFSRHALYALLENVQEIQTDHYPDLNIEGLMDNQFQPRANLPQRLVQELIDEGLPVLQPYLSNSVPIRESHDQSTPMIHLDPRHKMTLDDVNLHEALVV
jgi:chromosome partitioning protein